MAKAVWNGKVIAESDRFELVEGNVYFPADTIKRDYFQPSNKTTVCPWKGTAHYHSISVDGVENRDAEPPDEVQADRQRRRTRQHRRRDEAVEPAPATKAPGGFRLRRAGGAPPACRDRRAGADCLIG